MTAPRTIEDVVCPFCSLACDDLVIDVADDRLAVRGTDCPIAAREFARPVATATPMIDGVAGTLDEALARAAELLGTSRLPLFAGLGTDVAGMREVLALVERLGGIVDHAAAPGLMANLRAMQDGGWVATTLAEVRNRADFALFVGADPGRVTPRLVERCFRPTASLFGPLRRELVLLGEGPGLPPEPGHGTDLIACPTEHLLEAVTALRAMMAGARLHVENVAGIDADELEGLAQRLHDARYPVIVWAAGELPPAHREMIVEQLAGLTRDINARARCAALPLAGPDNVVGCNQVCSWATGVPLRTGFAGGVSDHDPERWRTEALLASGGVDCVVWISGLRELPPPRTDIPTVVLTHASDSVGPASVVIPIGRPGVEHAGSVYRTDGVVSLPVRALRNTGRPSAAEMLRALRCRLAANSG